MKSICLQDWEIRALQEGRKRRVTVLVKPQPIIGQYQTTAAGRMMNTYQWQSVVVNYCSLGGPRDKVFVKETWGLAILKDINELSYVVCPKQTSSNLREAAIFRSATPQKHWINEQIKWRSPVTMPEWASRFTLLIKSVRVERVNEISEEDARAEGASPNSFENGSFQMFPDGKKEPYRRAFAMSWEKHYPGSWQRGDWVWVVGFRKV